MAPYGFVILTRANRHGSFSVATAMSHVRSDHDNARSFCVAIAMSHVRSDHDNASWSITTQQKGNILFLCIAGASTAIPRRQSGH